MDGLRCSNLSLGIVLQARAQMAREKSAGGGEQIVVEMLLELPIVVVYYVAKLFQDRYSGKSVESICTWRT
eukprot:5683957-Karenia_brevis.AAC.1